MTWTKEQLLSVGDQLRRVTSDRSFETVVALLREDFLQRIAQSEYGDTAGRELNYRRLTALDDILGVMNSLILKANETAILGEQDEDEE